MPSANRLITDRMNETNMKRHHDRLKTMNPTPVRCQVCERKVYVDFMGGLVVKNRSLDALFPSCHVCPSSPPSFGLFRSPRSQTGLS